MLYLPFFLARFINSRKFIVWASLTLIYSAILFSSVPAAFSVQIDYSLGNENKTEIWALIEDLWDLDSRVRREAAGTLGEKGDPSAIDPLIKALGDGIPDVRRAAAKALEKLGEPLGRLILESMTGSREAMEKLAKRKDHRALSPLIKGSFDWDPNVRDAANLTLKIIDDPRTIDLLYRYLRNENLDVCEAAALTLGSIGNKRAVDLLIRALDDNNPKMRIAAAVALEKIREPSSLWHSHQSSGRERC